MPEQAADSERSTVAERAPFAALLVDFSRELRAAGLTVGTGDVMTYCSAMLPLDPTDLNRPLLSGSGIWTRGK